MLSKKHAVALLADHTIAAWGIGNNFGEQNVPQLTEDIVDVFAGEGFSLALTVSGKVIYWGKDEYLFSEKMATLPPIKAIGRNGYAFISQTDELVLWFEDAAIPENLGPIQDAIIEDDFSYALTTDGRLRAWNESDTFRIGAEFYDSVNFGQPEEPKIDTDL